MKKLTEDKIHLYILNPSLLLQEDISLIESRIESDIEFRKYIEEIKNFHLELNEFDSSNLDIDRITSKVLSKNQTPNKLTLKSILDENDTGDRMKLAAMKNLKIENEFKYFNTYASAEKLVLIRVLKNQSSNEYKFFLICEDMSRVVNACINFNEMKFIADGYGVVKLQSEFLRKDIDIKIQFPIARFEIILKDIKEKYISEFTWYYAEADIKKNDGKLLVKFLSGNTKPAKAFVIFDNEYSGFEEFEINEDKYLMINIPEADISQIKIVIFEK